MKIDDDNDDIRDQAEDPTPSTSFHVSISKNLLFIEDFFKISIDILVENNIVIPECVVCGCKLQ